MSDKATMARYWTHWYERHLQEAAEAKKMAEDCGAIFAPPEAREFNALFQIATMPDETDEWHGTDLYRQARAIAQEAIKTPPSHEPQGERS